MDWNETSVAKADSETITVNRNNVDLENFKKHRPSEDGDKITAKFGFSVYLHSLILHNELKDEEDYGKKFQKAMGSIAKCCLPLAYDFSDQVIEKITKMDLKDVITE